MSTLTLDQTTPYASLLMAGEVVSVMQGGQEAGGFPSDHAQAAKRAAA